MDNVPNNEQLDVVEQPETKIEQTQEKNYSKEEFEKLLQSETDKRVTEALKTAKSKWEVEFKTTLEKEKKEAERLAKLTEEEKQKEIMKQKDEELAKKEYEIKRRELKLDTVNALNDKRLPIEFGDFLMGADAETTLSNIKSFEVAFQKAIQNAVDEKLKGNPPGGSVRKNDLSYEQQLADARKKGDLLAEIKIKEEASRQGKILF